MSDGGNPNLEDAAKKIKKRKDKIKEQVDTDYVPRMNEIKGLRIK